MDDSEALDIPKEVLTFRRSVPDPAKAEKLEIRLEFTYEATGEEVTHSFDVLADPGAGADLALAAIVRYDRKGRQIIDLGGLMTYMERVMSAPDYKRFETLIEDPDQSIEMDYLGEVFNGLLERHTGRPTQRSQSSSAGPRRTGRSSTARRSLAAST